MRAACAQGITQVIDAEGGSVQNIAEFRWASPSVAHLVMGCCDMLDAPVW